MADNQTATQVAPQNVIISPVKPTREFIDIPTADNSRMNKGNDTQPIYETKIAKEER